MAARPGVLAQTARIAGDLSITISRCIQKEVHAAAWTAEIVMMIRLVGRQLGQQTMAKLERLPVVKEACNFIRVEG